MSSGLYYSCQQLRKVGEPASKRTIKPKWAWPKVRFVPPPAPKARVKIGRNEPFPYGSAKNSKDAAEDREPGGRKPNLHLARTREASTEQRSSEAISHSPPTHALLWVSAASFCQGHQKLSLKTNNLFAFTTPTHAFFPANSCLK